MTAEARGSDPGHDGSTRVAATRDVDRGGSQGHPQEDGMTTVQVFDPAMCCSTGVCGPDVDPVLPRFAADLEWLAAQGPRVERYNLAQEPRAFAANEAVRAALQEHGNEALPLVLIDGAVASHGRYPDRAELARLAGVPEPPARRFAVAAAPCCTPKPDDDGGPCC